MSAAPLSVLIVDDDLGDRKQLKRLLKSSGLPCRVTEVADVPTARSACNERRFDCAVVDYSMPGQSGFDLLQWFSRNCPYTGIVMATGQGDEGVVTDAFKLGIHDYLSKGDLSAESVRRSIEHAVETASLRQKVDDQRASLERFSAVLVHDLKAPIRLIQAISGMMIEEIEAGDTSELPELHAKIDMLATRMANLIDTLDTYNTMSGDDVVMTTVPMQGVLDQALENLSIVIGEAKITHDPLPEVTGNESQLIQLLQNLIGNGLKFCRAETPQIHVGVSSLQGIDCFSVRDNGIGIAEQDLKRIFEPFVRACSSTRFDGTGLGLATCATIVKRHQGSLWCESRLGEGTTFRFTLSGG